MSREQLLQIDPASEQVNFEQQERWWAIWTYGLDDNSIVKYLNQDVKKFFPTLQDIQTVSSLKVREPESMWSNVDSGYIFLLTHRFSNDFEQAVLRIKGVGGFIGRTTKKVKPNQFLKDKQVGDLIRVKSGPLTDLLGRIESIESRCAQIHLDYSGQLVRLIFFLEEIESIDRLA